MVKFFGDGIIQNNTSNISSNNSNDGGGAREKLFPHGDLYNYLCSDKCPTGFLIMAMTHFR